MTYLNVEDVLDNSLLDEECKGSSTVEEMVRKLCLAFLIGKDRTFEDPGVITHKTNFVSFWNRSKLNPLVFEPKPLTSKRLECTGTPDIVAIDKHGKVFLIQIKIKDWVTPKDWYRAAAWKALWNDNYPKKQATGVVIVSLGLEPNDYKIERRDNTSREQVIFEQCLLLKQYIATKPTK